ncbi:hypothetical protein [Streptomyces sp. JB150]|uniref:hypothetical protein n=1 Tax=Streptomyces sp. JB150 TaxID=2714844 RepID=UPI001408E5EF|nr:hypothetical protein [Streptomyces sp. JB150]QIJ61113.1 hypothetical protein G7Z13_03000 [Streptomyces sp. JB150]
MTLDTIFDLLSALPHVFGPASTITAGLVLARTTVRHLTLIWLTRGATPSERATILASVHARPRPSWRARAGRLVRRWRWRR